MCNVLVRQYNNVIDSSVIGIRRIMRIMFLLFKYDLISFPGEFLSLSLKALLSKLRFLIKKNKPNAVSL